MSRERARRRAVREAERERSAQQRMRRDARAARRRGRADAVRSAVPRRTRWRRPRGLLARRRRLQNGTIAGMFLVAMFVLFALTDSWWARAGGAVIAILALPVLVTLALDRRS